jgi:hypothetical protein
LTNFSLQKTYFSAGDAVNRRKKVKEVKNMRTEKLTTLERVAVFVDCTTSKSVKPVYRSLQEVEKSLATC